MSQSKERLLVVPPSPSTPLQLPKALQEHFLITEGDLDNHLHLGESESPKWVLMQAHHLQDTLKRASWMDTLMGIPSREHFNELLVCEWRRNARNHTPIALFLMEPDRFENYYEKHGKKAGDEVQQRIATSMASGIQRAGDVVGRFSTYRIACVLPETDNLGAVAVAERMRAAVSEMRILRSDDKNPYLTLSVGVVSLTPGRSDLLKDFVAEAGANLEKAVGRGGNQVVF